MNTPQDELAKSIRAIDEASKSVSDPTVRADVGQLMASVQEQLTELASIERQESDALAAYLAELAADDRAFRDSLQAATEEPEEEAESPPTIPGAPSDVPPVIATALQPKPTVGRDERYAFTDWVRESQSLIVPSESMAGAEAGSAVSESVVTPAEAEPVEIEKLGWSTWLQGTRGDAPAENERPATPEDEKRDGEWRKFLESDYR